MVSILKQIRLQRHLSQKKLAKLVNVSQPHINRLEQGETKLTYDLVVKLSKALEVSSVRLVADNLNISDSTLELIEIFEKLDTSTKQSFLRFLKGLSISRQTQDAP